MQDVLELESALEKAVHKYMKYGDLYSSEALLLFMINLLLIMIEKEFRHLLIGITLLMLKIYLAPAEPSIGTLMITRSMTINKHITNFIFLIYSITIFLPIFLETTLGVKAFLNSLKVARS